MRMPNGKVVDILSQVFNVIEKYLQEGKLSNESGGYIVGYQNNISGNITLEDASHPYDFDVKCRTKFVIKDPRHRVFLFKSKLKKSYYMGVWHTHPESIPTPSTTDWQDWFETVNLDRTGCGYVFFLIAGIDGARMWVGDLESKKITEISECMKIGNIYVNH